MRRVANPVRRNPQNLNNPVQVFFTGGSKREGLSSDYCAIQAQESKHKAQTSSWTGRSGFLDSFGLHNNCFAAHCAPFRISCSGHEMPRVLERFPDFNRAQATCDGRRCRLGLSLFRPNSRFKFRGCGVSVAGEMQLQAV